MEIKVLGPGCAKCNKTEKVVMDALADAGVAANVEKVSDMMKIAGYGVFGTPAGVVDGEVKSVGKIPKKEDVLSYDLKATMKEVMGTCVPMGVNVEGMKAKDCQKALDEGKFDDLLAGEEW